jgi:hypothetical protein
LLAIEGIERGGIDAIEGVERGGIAAIEGVERGGVDAIEGVERGGIDAIEGVERGGIDAIEGVGVERGGIDESGGIDAASRAGDLRTSRRPGFNCGGGVTGANRLAPWQPPARSPGASRDPTAVRSLGASRDPPAARGLPQYPWSMGKVYVYEENEQQRKQHRDQTVCKSQQNDYLQKTETRNNIRQRNDHLTCAGSGSNQLQWTRSEALGTG